jgi:two-component system response regulator
MTLLARPILLVEDNDDDAELAQMAFERAQVQNPLVRVSDGPSALAYLFGADGQPAPGERMPVVVLLDVKLPGLSGLEVLAQIRADERTRHLPVVMLTGSNEERDRLTAYANYANSYVRKPVDYDLFLSVTRQLGLYWTSLNEPPPIKTT